MRLSHTERLLTRSETCWNVTKCHACSAKRGYATFETSKSDHSCSTPQRHGHSAIIGTVLTVVANGCEHKSSVERTRPNPQTPRVKREPLVICIREKSPLRSIQEALRNVVPKISGPAPSVPLLWRIAELKADQHCDRWAELRSLHAFSSALSIVSSVPGREKVRLGNPAGNATNL